MKRSIVWFRNDLRLHDNEALDDALKHNDEIIPVYVIDPRIFNAQTSFGFEKTGIHRAKFILESLRDLRQSLRNLSSDLYVRIGKPEEVISDLARKAKTSYVYCNRERTFEEVKVQDGLETNLWSIGQEVRYYRGKMLYYTADLPFPITHCPDQFTTFRKEVEKFVSIREPIAPPTAEFNPLTITIAEGVIPSLKDLSYRTSQLENNGLHLLGGETQALAELQYYLWETDAIQNYYNTRNNLLGRDYSTKFSAYLSAGCLSPKLIYFEVKRYEEERVKNKSTYWLIFELLWRDFFRFMGKKHGDEIFKKSGTKKDTSFRGSENLVLFEKWAKGKTGIPFIDANMRELNATGFMSNRGRQNVASFLINDMKINWLLGAEYFESMLIDYDPCSNYGNWNYLAGVGSDPRDNRYFNIPFQTKKYDPEAKYIKHWLPELKDAPLDFLYNPISYDLEVNNVNYIQPCIHLKNW